MGVQSLEVKTFFGPKWPHKRQKNLLEMEVRLLYRPSFGGLLCKYMLARERASPSPVRGEVVYIPHQFHPFPLPPLSWLQRTQYDFTRSLSSMKPL